jgi:hypothetical protein
VQLSNDVKRLKRRALVVGLGAIAFGLATTARAVTPARTGAAGGYSWVVPGRWSEGPARSMRVATYVIPAMAGAEAGECAVFFFGGGDGGSVDENVDRWSRQFEGSPKPDRSEKTVRGVSLTVVKIAGTYLAPGGPMMQSQGKRPGYLLNGAIARTPQGNLFFKLTGPAATVTKAQAEWDALLASLGPASGVGAPQRPPIK